MLSFQSIGVARGDEIPIAIEAAKALGAAGLNVLASPMLHSIHQIIMERVAALHLLLLPDHATGAG